MPYINKQPLELLECPTSVCDHLTRLPRTPTQTGLAALVRAKATDHRSKEARRLAAAALASWGGGTVASPAGGGAGGGGGVRGRKPGGLNAIMLGGAAAVSSVPTARGAAAYTAAVQPAGTSNGGATKTAATKPSASKPAAPARPPSAPSVAAASVGSGDVELSKLDPQLAEQMRAAQDAQREAERKAAEAARLLEEKEREQELAAAEALPAIGSFRGGKRARGADGSGEDGSSAVERARGELRAFVQVRSSGFRASMYALHCSTPTNR